MSREILASPLSATEFYSLPRSLGMILGGNPPKPPLIALNLMYARVVTALEHAN